MRAAGRPLVALALAAAVLAAPAPRAAGQGSSGIVGVTNIGSGAEETWVLLPGEDPPILPRRLPPRCERAHAVALPGLARPPRHRRGVCRDLPALPAHPEHRAHDAQRSARRRVGGGRACPARAVRIRRPSSPEEAADGRRRSRARRQPRLLLRGQREALGAARPGGDRQHLPHVGEYLRPAARAGSSQRTGDRPDARRGSGRARVPRPAPRLPQALPDGPVAANAPLQTTPFAINTFWAPVDELIG